MDYLDIKGNLLSLWDDVIVPDPNETDIHQHSFSGMIVKFLTNGNAIVVDGDDEEFELECDRLTLSTDGDAKNTEE